MAQINLIRHQIEATLYPNGFSNDGWAAVRKAALVPPKRHSCSPIQEKRLWIAAALRRAKPLNQPVTAAEVNRRLVECRGDLSVVIPGFVALPDLKSLPSQCLGRELPALIQEWTDYQPTDGRLREWCRKLGFEFSRNAVYSGSQAQSLILLWVRMRVAERERSRKQAYKNFHPDLDAA